MYLKHSRQGVLAFVLFFGMKMTCKGQTIITRPPVSTESPTAAPTHYTWMDFDYDPYSPWGPPFWGELDLGHHEFLKWTREYGYDGIGQNLDVEDNDCDKEWDETRPSPVNLLPNDICLDDHEILSRKIRRTDCKFEDFTFLITPHYLRVHAPPINNGYCNPPHVDLPNGFANKWPIGWIELHMRSEHTIDGRRFDAEIQMMHLGQDDQRNDIAIVSVMLEATATEDDEKVQWLIDAWQDVADKRDKACDRKRRLEEGEEVEDEEDEEITNASQPKRVDRSLHQSTHPAHAGDFKDWEEVDEELEKLPWDDPRLVYGDFYHKDSDTGEIKRVYTDEQEAEYYQSRRKLQRPEKLPRNKMFPYSLFPTIYYYRYQGSITHPPCSDIANWRILDTPREISVKQLRQLGKLMTGYRDPQTCEYGTKTHPVTGENRRPTMKMNPERQDGVVHCQRENFWYWRYWPDQV